MKKNRTRGALLTHLFLQKMEKVTNSAGIKIELTLLNNIHQHLGIHNPLELSLPAKAVLPNHHQRQLRVENMVDISPSGWIIALKKSTKSAKNN